MTLFSPANSALAVITIRAAKKVIWNDIFITVVSYKFHNSVVAFNNTPFVMVLAFSVLKNV